MTRRAQLRQSDLTRAAKVAKADGVCIVIEARDGTVYRIEPMRSIVPPEDPFAAWKAKREGNIEGRS